MKILCWALLWTGGSAIAIRSFAGPFDVQVDHGGVCEDALQGLGVLKLTKVKVTRDRKNTWLRVLSGRVSWNYYFSDALKARVNVGIWSTRGGWKRSYLVQDFLRPCTFMKTYFPSLMKFFIRVIFGYVDGVDCPLPPLLAEVEEFPLHFRQNVFREFVYGRFKTETQILDTARNDTVLGCVLFEFRTVPRSDRTEDRYDQWPQGYNFTDRIRIEYLPPDFYAQAEQSAPRG